MRTKFIMRLLQQPPITNLAFNASATPTNSYSIADFTAEVLNLDVHGNPLTYKSAMAGPNRREWIDADATEFRRLISTTKTMHAIHASSIPASMWSQISYLNKRVREKPDPTTGGVKRRVRGTFGGNIIKNQRGFVSTNTADVPIVKCVCQSVVSTPGSIFSTLDISDFYVAKMHRLERSEFLRIPVTQIPESILAEYSLMPYATSHKSGPVVYFEVIGGMYGLPQAGKIAHDYLVDKVLAPAGY